MIEQYVICYFWLVLLVYVVVEKHTKEHYLDYCATGTCLTSVVLAPIAPLMTAEGKNWFGYLFEYLKGLICAIVGTIIAIGLFGRSDVFFGIITDVQTYFTHTGSDLSLGDRLLQFFDFIEGMFAAPSAGPIEIAGHYSWQLHTSSDLNVLGLLLFTLCIISLVINRKNKIANIFGIWVIFSFVLLGLVGWGTDENGLILYCLYFQWAYLGLIVMFVRKVDELIEHPICFGVLLVISIGCLLTVNLGSMYDLIVFGSDYYPGWL